MRGLAAQHYFSHSDRYVVVSHCVKLHFLKVNDLNIFSCAYLSFTFTLW